MFGFVSLGVSFASLVISCAALYWSRMARIKVKKSRTGKAVMVFGFPMSLEEMDTVRAEFESQLAYQSRIMREDRMMRF